MFWIPLAAAAISAAASRNASREQRLATQTANDQNAATQREFAQMGLQWKVADAKAAGLHPLSAIGAQGASFSPSFVTDTSKADFSREMGQNLSRAALAMDPTAREMSAAQLDAVKAGAAKDWALAAAADSEAARLRGPSVPVAQSFPVPMPGVAETQSIDGGPYRRLNETPIPPIPGQFDQPPPYLSSTKGEPGFKIFKVPGVGEVILPNASNMAEALESLENPILQAAVLSANGLHYGKDSKAVRMLEARRKMPKAWSDPWGALGDKLDTYRR